MPVLIQEAIAESVIRRFNACYDCLLKVLSRYLVVLLGVMDLPNNPNPVLRLAHQNRLFQALAEQRLLYANSRNASSHDYDGEKAKACLYVMADFIKDVVDLYQTMRGCTGITPSIDVTAEQREPILSLIERHLPGTTA